MRNWHEEKFDTEYVNVADQLENIEAGGGVIYLVQFVSKKICQIVWYDPEQLEYIEVEVEFSTSKDRAGFGRETVYETVDAVSRTITTHALDGWQLVSKAYDKGYAYLTFSRPKPNVIYGGSEM